jgi:hypothetical protein
MSKTHGLHAFGLVSLSMGSKAGRLIIGGIVGRCFVLSGNQRVVARGFYGQPEKTAKTEMSLTNGSVPGFTEFDSGFGNHFLRSRGESCRRTWQLRLRTKPGLFRTVLV